MSITKEQIFVIADTLNKEGIKPTLAAIRRRLGAGSFTTISEAANEWKLMQRANAEIPHENIPEALKEYLQRFGTVVWSEAVNTANNRFSQEQQAMIEQLNEKEVYYSELEKIAKDYDNELEAAKSCIENLRNELETTSNKLSIKEKEYISIQQTLQQEQAEQKLLVQHNSALQNELAHTNKTVDKLQNNLTALINRFDTINSKFDGKFSSEMTKKINAIHNNN